MLGPNERPLIKQEHGIIIGELQLEMLGSEKYNVALPINQKELSPSIVLINFFVGHVM